MPPKSADDLAQQATALLAMGQMERCYEAASRALALEPEHLVAFRLQAACAVELGRPDAERQAKALLQREPDSAYSHRLMCRLYRRHLNNYVMAVRAAGRACELEPQDSAAAFELAASLAKCGDRRAIVEARRAVALEPDLENRALLMAILSQFDQDVEANQMAEQILAEDPENMAAMLVKGDSHVRKSWGAHSLAWYGRALTSSPQAPQGVRTAIDEIISVWGHRFLLASLIPLVFIAPMMIHRAIWPLLIMIGIFVAWLVRLLRLIPRAHYRFLRGYPRRQPLRFMQWLTCFIVWTVMIVAVLVGEDAIGLAGLCLVLLFGGVLLGHVPVRER